MTRKRRRSKRLVIFVPEGKRAVSALPVELNDPWVGRLLEMLAREFGGATAYGRGVGAWREGESEESVVYYDRITVVESWIDPRDPKWEDRTGSVCKTIARMCGDLGEQAIAWMVDGVFDLVRSR